MKSPFPSMDPYLEMHWRDVHATLIVHARAMISRQLSGDLRARVDGRLVVEHGLPTRRHVAPLSGVALVEPPVVTAPDEEAPHRFIEIIDPSSGGQVVTVVEFLSPTNKHAGDGREKYQRKQRDVVNASINLVEVDLTRAGRRREPAYPLAAPPTCRISGTRSLTYGAIRNRGVTFGRFEGRSFGSREEAESKNPGRRLWLRTRRGG